MRVFLRLLRKLVWFVLLVFIMPALASLVVWEADASKPKRWNEANWASAGILPHASEVNEAVIHIMAARTGRWKGAFSLHSWIVMKRAGAQSYDRYEVVGWGKPLRKNAYAADARWYSNEPEILYSIRGEDAQRHIRKFEQAIVTYPKAERGDYVVWPGPNSNSFIAYLLNEVSGLGLVLPSNAIGRDWPLQGKWLHLDPDYRNLQVSFGGLAGFSFGQRHGIEINFIGLVAGLDVINWKVKVPGFGSISVL